MRRRGVETVILAGADTHGIMRGKRLPIAELPASPEHGVALCEVVWALPVDEREPVRRPPGPAGYFPRPGYPDMLAMPDLETARIVPWHDRTALLLCDFVDRDGARLPVSPRAVLRSVVARARAMGVEPVVGVELEFYLLRETPRSVAGKRPSQLVAVDERPSVYGVVAASRNEPFTGAVRDTLRDYGLAVEACNPESGPGQFEINLRAAPALQAADEAFLLKSAVKEIAARQGLLATFMAKPRSDWPGSSCHLHLSLREGSRHAALHRRAAGGDGGADRAVRADAELLPALRPALVGGHDRDLGRRQPLRRPARDRRHAGGAPAGGRGRQPVPGRRGGARGRAGRRRARVRAAAARRRRRVRRRSPRGAALPTTLGEATDLLERSALARDWLGADVVEHCVAMRRAELAAQAAEVTDWETARYLESL